MCGFAVIPLPQIRETNSSQSRSRLRVGGKMMNCLALAAKVRGAPAEVETIQEHSEIIISGVQNGCESLIPPDPLNTQGLRKLADSLVQAERWDLALEFI
ncbi:Zinc finger FYVE domain-containing protein 26 homolog [Eumeta japonica]|uniref:Zinc finger FYVE domain-containing protein 26 homolog n=1 Tax=Eumeta variegata TaxID=151549 RepID=A0A4C1SC30_EUMVA|nr:Zinc finger FYVE domain-containing protein 26 homolog [Eumeta japonica]